MSNPYVEKAEFEVTASVPSSPSVTFRVAVSWTRGAPSEFETDGVYVADSDADITAMLSLDAYDELVRLVGERVREYVRERRIA